MGSRGISLLKCHCVAFSPLTPRYTPSFVSYVCEFFGRSSGVWVTFSSRPVRTYVHAHKDPTPVPVIFAGLRLPPSVTCCICLQSVLSFSLSVIFSVASKSNQPFLPRGLINIQVFPPLHGLIFKRTFNSLVHLECISVDSVTREGLTAGL